MKKLLVIFVLLLLAGGGGYYWFVLRAAKPEAHVEAPPPVPSEEFLRFDRFVVPLVHNGIVDGFSRLEITLDVVDFETRKDIERDVPRLRNALMSYLYAYLPLRRSGGSADAEEAEALKKRLLAIIVKQVGPNKVKDLYFEEYIDVAPMRGAPPPS